MIRNSYRPNFSLNYMLSKRELKRRPRQVIILHCDLNTLLELVFFAIIKTVEIGGDRND